MGALAGSLTPTAPRLPGDWDSLSHQARLDASVESYMSDGSARPRAGRPLQLVRLIGFAAGGLAVVSLTDGVGSLLDITSWWAEPVVFQKLAVWTLLWQLLGLGRGLAPFAVGALPPVAGLSYWLTPGTMRLAPWPQRVPFTAGTRRSLVDVVLYAIVIAIGAGLLGFTGTAGGTLPVAGVWALLASLAALGLRDRTPVLAARPEIFVPLLVALLLPAGDAVTAIKLVLVTVGWLAAVTAANRHLPFAVATTLADAPWLRSPARRRGLWQRDDHDIVPGDVARWTSNLLVVLAFVLPPVLLFARGGVLTTVTVALAVAVLAAVASTMSRTGQLEIIVFLGYATVVMFGHYAAVGFASLSSVVPVALLAVALLAVIVAAATLPELTGVLSPWRHASGSGPVSVWLLRADAADRFEVPVHPHHTEALHYRDLAVLALHPNGRALDGLLRRAVDDPDSYLVRSAGFMSGAAIGWSIDCGHGHDRQLLAAIQERCGFEPGELRVVTLAGHSTLHTDYRYRIVDAAAGLVEDGLVDVDDMVDRVPWRDPAAPSIPVEVKYSEQGFTGYTAPPEFDMFKQAVLAADPVEETAPRSAPARPVPRAVTARVAHPTRPAPAPRTPTPVPIRSWAKSSATGTTNPVAPFVVPEPLDSPIDVALRAATPPRPKPTPPPAPAPVIVVPAPAPTERVSAERPTSGEPGRHRPKPA